MVKTASPVEHEVYRKTPAEALCLGIFVTNSLKRVEIHAWI